MTNIDHVTRKANKTFILVCANFAMLAILFLGLGFVVFQAATLVTGLKQDLARAEQQVTELKNRIQGMDSEVAMEKVIDGAVTAIGNRVAESLPDTEALARLSGVPDTLATTTKAVQDLGAKVQDLDSDQVAQRVAYHVLRGLGQGFDEAAESRKPEGL